jgi:phosphoglycolate phosphatase
MVGDGVGKLVERVLLARGLPMPPAPLVARFLRLYAADIATRTRPYPGVVDGLEALAGRGIALAVCTNKLGHATHALLAALDLGRFFPVVVSGDSLAAPKPDPAPLRLALDRLGIAAAAAAMVGDHRNDVLAARAAGTAALFARYGYGLASLGALKPDATIDQFADLPGALEAM